MKLKVYLILKFLATVISIIVEYNKSSQSNTTEHYSSVPDLLLVLEQPLVPRGLGLEVRLDGVKVLAVLVQRLEEHRLRMCIRI